VTSLFKYEQIETTDAKAKELKPIAEKMVTLAKRGELSDRRQALAYIREKGVAHKLFEELKERYIDRQGGYLRIVKKGTRKGDGAPVSIVQLLPKEETIKKKRAKRKSKPEASASRWTGPKEKKKEQAKQEEKTSDPTP